MFVSQQTTFVTGRQYCSASISFPSFRKPRCRTLLELRWKSSNNGVQPLSEAGFALSLSFYVQEQELICAFVSSSWWNRVEARAMATTLTHCHIWHFASLQAVLKAARGLLCVTHSLPPVCNFQALRFVCHSLGRCHAFLFLSSCRFVLSAQLHGCKLPLCAGLYANSHWLHRRRIDVLNLDTLGCAELRIYQRT